MSGFYERRILPRLLQCGCSAPPVRRRRAELIPQADGRVLEVGCGGGLNFGFYDARRVRSVVAIDPSPELLVKAGQAAGQARAHIGLLEGRAEALSFPDRTFDTVVVTFTLCSVQDHAASLGEIRRVLKPAGRLLFCEHGLAPDASVQRWQRGAEPIWSRLFGGCHLTRPVGDSLRAAGFKVRRLESGYLARPRFAAWVEWGMAQT